MSTVTKDINKVRNLKYGENTTLNWYDGGGGVVYRIEDELHLYSVPQYGGEETLEAIYGIDYVEDLVNLAHTWN